MAAPTGGSSKDRQGKKPHKNKLTSKKWEHYKDGKKDKTCPRCGAGTFLAKHGDRLHCGKCSYTEFTKK